VPQLSSDFEEHLLGEFAAQRIGRGGQHAAKQTKAGQRRWVVALQAACEVEQRGQGEAAQLGGRGAVWQGRKVQRQQI